MSWLSKWWRSGGREQIERLPRDLLLWKFKQDVVTKLRVLLAVIDGLDTQKVKAELVRVIEEVEGW